MRGGRSSASLIAANARSVWELVTSLKRQRFLRPRVRTWMTIEFTGANEAVHMFQMSQEQGRWHLWERRVLRESLVAK